MTLRHLKIFLCVCDELNMTAAAEKLHIAQPSVSQVIAELEKHYAVKLFERLGRKLFITSAGNKLLTYARHIVNLNKEAEDAMREITHSGVIRVGASVTVGTCILTDIITDFIKGDPFSQIISTVNNTKIIEEMLLVDELDIGLVEGRIHSSGLLCEPFMDDELVLVSSTSHPFALRGSIMADELEGQGFIIREEGSGTRELFESVMTSKGVNWRIAGIYNNAETIKNAVAAGLALTVMSRMAVRKEVQRRELAIVNIEGLQFRRHFSIVLHRNKYVSPLLDKLIRQCKGRYSGHGA